MTMTKSIKNYKANTLSCVSEGERFCLNNCLVIAVLFAENLFKKRYEKADFAAPGPHAIRLENGKAHVLDICSC